MLTTSQVQNFAVSTLELKDYTTNKEENKPKKPQPTKKKVIKETE